MDKIEELKKQKESEENDLRYLSLGKKIIREERLDKFEKTWLPRLQALTDVNFNEDSQKYTFELNDLGLIDYYPKANNLLIRKKNKWIKPGLRWLSFTIVETEKNIKNFLNQKP